MISKAWAKAWHDLIIETLLYETQVRPSSFQMSACIWSSWSAAMTPLPGIHQTRASFHPTNLMVVDLDLSQLV